MAAAPGPIIRLPESVLLGPAFHKCCEISGRMSYARLRAFPAQPVLGPGVYAELPVCAAGDAVRPVHGPLAAAGRSPVNGAGQWKPTIIANICPRMTRRKRRA